MYQGLYDKAITIMRQDACVKFYAASKPVYLEIDASLVSFGASLLQL